MNAKPGPGKVVRKCLTRMLLALVILQWLPGANVHAQSKLVRVGAFVKDIRLPDTAGITRSLAQMKGKVVLIDFWASWCGPCRQANPALLKIYNQYSGRNFVIYGISLDKSLQAWRSAIVKDQLTWMHVNDRGEGDESVLDAWGIDYIPTSFLLNAEGKIVAINPDNRKLKAYLKKHL